MRKLLFSAVLLLFPAMLFASVTAASASLPVSGFYYGEAGQQAMLSFKINQSELLSMTGDEWTNLPISDVVINESEPMPEQAYAYDVFTWSLTGRYTGNLNIKFTFWALEASMTRGNNTIYTIPSHHEYLLYLTQGSRLSIVKNESTLNKAENNLKGFADNATGIWESNTPYISGVAEGTLISKGYVKYMTYSGTGYSGTVDESGRVRLRVTRLNALAGTFSYRGTVRVEITTGT